MKKLLSLLVAAVFALSLGLATLAKDKPAEKAAEKPAASASEGKKKAKKKHADKKTAEGEATKGAKK
jgi:hypothetical protein